MPDVGHSVRTTVEVSDTFSGSPGSIIGLINANGGDSTRYPEVTDEATTYPAPGLSQYARPGYFNDPDALEVGNGGMTDVEYRSQFSLWAIMAAPLIASNDVRTMSATTLEILTNPEVIAVDQDALGIQGRPISASTTLEVWVKPLRPAQTFAVVLFNRTEESSDISVAWEDLDPNLESARVRDLWQHSNLGTYENSFTAAVEPHGVVMLRVTGE